MTVGIVHFKGGVENEEVMVIYICYETFDQSGGAVTIAKKYNSLGLQWL